MIAHCVFCNFKSDVDERVKRELLTELKAFSLQLEGVQAFHFGPNKDFERKSPNHDWGFVVHFDDEDSLSHYAIHETHKLLGGRLCDLCEGGADGIVVFDLDV